MGDTFHHFVKGLESGTCMVDFFNDLATGKTNATLQAAYGTTVTVVAKATSAAVSATNPTYTFSVLVNNLTPINGKVGEISTQSITFTINSAVAYAIA
jgi:hypothetical protein